MKYLIKAIKHGGVNAKSIHYTHTWPRAEKFALQALSTNKYSKVIIERSNIVKVFKPNKKAL